jgi:hypothetical protein
MSEITKAHNLSQQVHPPQYAKNRTLYLQCPKHLEKDMTGILRLPDQLVAKAKLRGVAEPLPEVACRERNSRLDRLLDSRASEKLTTVGPQVECVLKKVA